MRKRRRLPNDLLANVLWRLWPRDLAAARCVSSGWRAVVDSYWLLHPYVNPMGVAGIFVNYIDYCRQHLLVRPGCNILGGSLDFLPRDNPGQWRSPVGDHLSFLFDAVPVDGRGRWSAVRDHCNGLVLYDDGLDFHVVNPATRRWARLPQHARAKESLVHLVFEPVVSRHYEVVLIPSMPEMPKPAGTPRPSPLLRSRPDPAEAADPYGSTEWPPLQCMVHVFSSRTWQWEERALVRIGDAAGTVADLHLDPEDPEHFGAVHRLATYWQGDLYVHCRGAYIMRLSLQHSIYQVIKTPADGLLTRCYLGKSEKGVYFAAMREWYDLHVWILNISYGRATRALKHENDLKTTGLLALSRMSYSKQIDGPWVLEEDDDINEDGNNEPPLEEDNGINEDGNIEPPVEEDNGINDEQEPPVEEDNIINEHGNNDEQEPSVEQDNNVNEDGNNGEQEPQAEGVHEDGNNDDQEPPPEEEYYWWNTDEEDFVDIEEGDEKYLGGICILGFHPFKEIMYFCSTFGGVAYHLNTGKVQCLGDLRPKRYNYTPCVGIRGAFPYTPCMTGEFPDENFSKISG